MKSIIKLFVGASFSLFSLTSAFGQLPAGSICLGDDTTVCANQSVTIVNCTPTTGGTTSGINLTSPTNVSLSDDAWSGVIPMGFSFNFYGITYTSCLIGANGIVSFNLASAGGYCPWSLNGTPLPTTTVPGGLNAAMGCYQDLNPSNFSSGPVQYQTIGTAPNRIFVVLYKGVTAFSCTTSCNYSAFLFYETSNKIEYHIGTKATCTWNSNRAIQGTQNGVTTALVAHTTPGRNNTVWTATSDGKEYVPTSPTSTMAYTINTIPYVPVSSAGTSTPLLWKNTLNQTFPYNSTTHSLTVASPPAGTTGYFLTSSSCGVSIGSVSDTTWITRINPTVTATSTTDICSSGQGTVTATPGAGTAPFTYSWPTIPGGNTATVNNVTTGTYFVTMTDANGCTAQAGVAVQNVQVNSSGTTTQVSCAGGSDGTATATMTPAGATTTYLWNDPMAQTSQTAVGLSAGSYMCTITSSNGCTSTVNVTITEITPMTAVISSKVDVNCHAANNGIINLAVGAGTMPYTYNWSGSSSTGPTASDLYVGPQQVTITDALGCILVLDTVLAEPPALYLDSMATDSMICSEASIVIGAVGLGGSTPYTYTWYENGVPISTNQFVLVDPVNSGTQYKVVLSEACGSPTTTDSLIITFPTEIIPMASPVPYEACAPDTFLFLNTSTNGGEIASTVWTFSNGTTHTVPLQDSVSQEFVVAGMYDANMTVTSIYGCIYTNSFPQIISALQRPKAQFGMSSNPTTIFETTIGMVDKSINAVQWNWSAPASSPSSSTLQNPVFNFPHEEAKYDILLMVTNSKGCTDTVRGLLDVQNDFILYAPNTFTPDGDQHNQTWHVITEGLDFNDFELEVYNRWGQLVWHSFDPDAEWDGTFNNTVIPQGSYNWKLRTRKVGTEDPLIFTGNVMIIR